MIYTSHSPQDTKDIAKSLIQKHPHQIIWALKGDLGAGKTQFVKGVAEALGLSENTVTSPTYAYLEDHKALIHYDLYRLQEADLEFLEMLEEQKEREVPILIEWPEVLWEHIGQEALTLSFVSQEDGSREIELISPVQAK